LVSAIIPARNEEASIARAIESVASQPEIDEVIVVDDGSTDGTAGILAELRSRVPKLKVLQAGELPAGWVGKNHAVSVGAAAAEGDWLLFTDADTIHLPGAMRRALADAAERNAVLVSYSPEQEMETWWERALTSVVYWRLSARYSFDRINDPSYSDAAANGQFLLIHREEYETAGGHRAVAGDVLEDVALARRVKQRGGRLHFASGRGIVRTRMYRSFGAMWEGWTKNLYPLFGGGFTRYVAEMPELLLLVGLLFIMWKSVTALDWLGLILAACIVGIRWGTYAAYLRRNLLPASYIQYYVLGVCLFSGAMIESWLRHVNGSVQWKGRKYAPRSAVGMEKEKADSSLRSE
jgi:glycosyltransferase involved in cell wall biosynthesis